MNTWVLLRGLTRESRHWGEFASSFAEQFPEATVVALDLPGNGRLHRMRSPSRVEDMLAHCRQQLLDRGLQPPYYLLALSLGAMVAAAWSSRYPDELRGCVLINTSLRPINPFFRRLRPNSLLTVLAVALRNPTSPQRERAILALTSRKLAASSQVLGRWCSYARENPVARANALRQLLAAARYRAPAAAPHVPLLILASAADALVDPRCSRQLAACWQGDLVEHPSAGHDLPLDDGPWVAAQVRRWLDPSQARDQSAPASRRQEAAVLSPGPGPSTAAARSARAENR